MGFFRALLVGAFFSIGLGATAAAETASPAPEDNGGPGWLILPILAYSPDTSVMFGASALRFFSLDDEAESSVFSPVSIFTAKKQVLVFLGARLEWERSRLEVTPSFIKFPDKFFGIGRDVRDGDEEDYTPEALGLNASWRREVLPSLRAGFLYELQRHRLTETAEGGVLASGRIDGTEETLLSMPGLVLGYDTRDNQWSPRRGLWLTTEVRFSRDGFGSDRDFTSSQLDLRGFWPVGEKAVLGVQFLGTTLDGASPFFFMPTLGGQEGLRGYLQGRYRDRTRALGRVEYRSGDIWGRFGWVAFAGIGDVADRPADLSFKGELWTLGGGLRFTLDEKERVKLRLDIGRGNGDGGFFISFGEAF